MWSKSDQPQALSSSRAPKMESARVQVSINIYIEKHENSETLCFIKISLYIQRKAWYTSQLNNNNNYYTFFVRSERKVKIIYYLNNLFLFYLISAVPNELCKNWSWRPSEHSILRIYNLKQDIEKETQHKSDKLKKNSEVRLHSRFAKV